MYNELKKYMSQHGNVLVPRNYNPNPALGSWVKRQRDQYKQFQKGKSSSTSSSVITQERISKLEALNFVWEPFEITWMERYNELIKYKKQYGDCLIPQMYYF
mmetsp:Transcript_27027/g.40155  ORF Transcript_27027/g.40155 Transcript_27027/m.40155 type:complete len:102 (-) Transcript_27027:435-740(-)